MAEDRARKVSAIIVVRNGEAYLAEAIDSVRGQTFPDWELLIVDDGSTDQTARIAKDYEAKYSGIIRLVSHAGGENRGIAASRNLGLANAHGTYIGFLDADDIWLPEKLTEQVAIMEADPELGLVYGRTLIWHSWKPDADNKDFYYPLGVDPDRRYDPPRLFRILLENKSQTPTTCNALMRADLLKALNGFEERFRLMFEDQTFFARALAIAPAYVSGRTWAKYRQHPESCSALSSRSGRDEAARLAFLHWLRGSMAGLEVQLNVRLTIWRSIGYAYASLAKQWLRRHIPA
jgi:glycosyltransferase involved in cell wall biosynthesis